MKKLALATALVATTLAFTAFTSKSKGPAFEGVITYSVSVDNPQAASMMAGSSVKVYMKGDKIKATADMGMYKQITIKDAKNPDRPTVLLDIMGNKYQLKIDKKKDDDKAPAIKYTDETKQIAGYTCHKAEVTITDKAGQAIVSTVYYTEELPAYDGASGEFKGLKGFPLEYTLTQQGINISVSATKVDKQAVPDDTFNMPTGYKLMTEEEMQADIEKNMGAGGN